MKQRERTEAEKRYVEHIQNLRRKSNVERNKNAYTRKRKHRHQGD